jgi:hypothetical protein
LTNKLYTPILMTFFLCLLVVILFPTLVLWHAGETWSESSIAKHQIENDSIFSYGLLDQEIPYKKAMYNATQPHITIIGSSRVLEFRQDMFSEPFYNMGRGLNLQDLRGEIEFLLRNPNLKIVLLGLDYWNFGNHFCENPTKYKKIETAIGNNSENIAKFSNIIPRQILDVWPMIFDGRISLKLFWYYVTTGHLEAKNKLGLRPLYSNRGGYLNDGFYVYLNLFNDLERLENEREKAIVRHLDEGMPYQISKDEQFCNQAISDLLWIEEILEGRGVEFIVFLPPLPKRHAMLFSTSTAKSIHEKMLVSLREIEARLPIYNYLDIQKWTFSEQEFIDEIHPGEVISYRILANLSQTEESIKHSIQSEFIQEQIINCSGRPVCSQGFERYSHQPKW